MVKVRQNLMNSSLYSWKSPYTMIPTRIVVHNTANDASAANEIAYMNKSQAEGGKQVSYHYAVDDVEAVQGLPENRNGFHAGDGANGKGNREGIAIEICYSKSGGDRFIKAEQNAVELIVDILNRYGWGIDKVTKHQDYSNKYCPHRTLDMGWDRFINMIKEKLGQSTQPSTPSTPNTSTSSTYTGSSIVDALKSVGVDSSFANRQKIAQANGISNYTGTPEQNVQLLNKFKNGTLVYTTTSGSTGTTITYYPKCTYTGSSIVDALKSINVDSSFANRKKIATKNGINDYQGSPSDNTRLLNLLKQGKLIKY